MPFLWTQFDSPPPLRGEGEGEGDPDLTRYPILSLPEMKIIVKIIVGNSIESAFIPPAASIHCETASKDCASGRPRSIRPPL